MAINPPGNTLQEAISEYRKLLESGENLEVIERFYADHIVQLENSGEPVMGKEKLLEMEKANIEKVKNLEQKITNLVIAEKQGLVMGEMVICFEGPQWGKKRLEEAFVQKWEGGKMVYQRFYYGGFQDISA